MPHALPSPVAQRFVARELRRRRLSTARRWLRALALTALAVATAAFAAGCATGNFDKRITCIGPEAYFVIKFGPVATIDRAADADPLCAKVQPRFGTASPGEPS
ncbi:MAG: hypothetical protein KIT60_06935 [Burkholderiaceae bacterium]|nr:hypothetical protein [Burkholderiaceae bacterium]